MDKETADLVGGLGWRLVLHNPHYGVNGRPYTLVATKGTAVVKEGFWSKTAALDRRDKLLDEGWPSVIVLGLPTVLSVHMSATADPSPASGPTCPQCGSPMVGGAPHGDWEHQWECRRCGQIMVPAQ